MSKYLHLIRKATSLTLLTTWLVTGATGFLLLMTSLGIRVPTVTTDIHTYMGFTALGVSVIHAYMNSAALRNYLGIKRR